MERVYMKQVFVLLAIALAFLLVVGALLHSQVYGQERDDYYEDMTASERRIVREMENKYLSQSRGNYLRFWGDTKSTRTRSLKGI